MKNFYIILILFFSFTIYSCAKKSDTSSTTTTNTDNTTTTELEGTWVVSCYSSGSNYIVKTLTFSGTDVTDKWEYHSDSSCATDNYSWDTTYSSLSIGDEATFDTYGSSGGSGHYTTMTVDTNTYTPLVASDVTWSNDNNWCGESDWVLNTPQSIAGRTCGGDTWWNLNITIYGLYILDGTKLMPNLNSVSYPSSVSSATSNTYNKQ